jgi:IclR family acetate operon transcriptional repressor
MKAGPKRHARKSRLKVVEEDEGARGGAVQSVDRAMLLLEALGEDEEGYRLTDLAIRTGLSPSTAHRLLTTLEKRRFVAYDQSDAMWHVGRQSFAVGSAFVRRRNFVAPALPFLRRLRDLTHETANLGIVDDGEVIVLTQVESREIMRAITRVGGRAPMITSGIGKAILATYSDDDVVAIIQRHGMRRLTPKSVVRAGQLRDALEIVRRDGYAVDDEEFLVGLRCVAAVVYNDQGEALAAISVSGLASRVLAERVPELGRLVRETARELTLALGGRLP